jgi:Flp pilus assembly protein TadD
LAIALREAGKYYGEQKGDLATAMKHLNESWQIAPDDPETARLLGVANGVQGKNAEALEWFKKAVGLAPDNASYLFDLGTAYFIAGDKLRGEEYRQRAIAINPEVLKEKGK